ncbi:MAG: hypothetical protein ACJASQ_000741 [Crocinitomicaceae bacterium]|jgi:hypothetical protein
MLYPYISVVSNKIKKLEEQEEADELKIPLLEAQAKLAACIPTILI